MRFRHVTILHDHGMHFREDEPTQIFIDYRDLRVFFARDIDAFVTDIIRRTVISSTMLGRMFLGDVGEGEEMTFNEHGVLRWKWFRLKVDSSWAAICSVVRLALLSLRFTRYEG